MIRHAPNAQLGASPRPMLVQLRASVFGAVATLSNLWAYTATGFQKLTPSVSDGAAFKTVLEMWVYTATGFQKIFG